MLDEEQLDPYRTVNLQHILTIKISHAHLESEEELREHISSSLFLVKKFQTNEGAGDSS